MARKIDLTKSPESHCPRWDSCEINKCCLHKDYEKLKNDPSDQSQIRKDKCCSRNIRKEIGTAFKLKYGGMTIREFNGAKRWAGLSDADKKANISKLHDLSPVTRLIKAGCVVTPKKKIKARNHELERKKSLREGLDGLSVGCDDE